jgi:two-component system CheB/CheR fusion protein
MADVRSLMEVRAQEKDLPLSVEYRDRVPAWIETDKTRLRQILINLLSNAIKFTSRGSVRLLVGYRAGDEAHKPRLRFDVVDTGIGMSAAQIEKVFRPFQQADDSITRKFGGTGLGLSISQRLAGMLGGRIDVTSEPGKGSCFSLLLPTPRVAKSDLVEPAAEIAASETPAAEIGGRVSGKILVVDDRRDIRFLAQYFLEEAGAGVTTAANGRHALQLVRRARDEGRDFDVIFMDMQMPVMDGFAATRELRNNGYRGAIVALTAGAMTADREACLAAGCDAHIAKPIEGARLVALAARLVGAAADGSESAASRDTAAAPPGRAGNTRRILLVDDNRDSAGALARLLSMRGHDVNVVYDGASAVTAAGRDRPDVMIVDLGLPDISGYDVAQQVREKQEGAGPMLIVLSGQAADAERAAQCGFDHCLVKPVGLEELQTLVSGPQNG